MSGSGSESNAKQSTRMPVGSLVAVTIVALFLGGLFGWLQGGDGGFSVSTFVGVSAIIFYFLVFWVLVNTTRSRQDAYLKDAGINAYDFPFLKNPDEGARAIRTALYLTLSAAVATGVFFALGNGSFEIPIANWFFGFAVAHALFISIALWNHRSRAMDYVYRFPFASKVLGSVLMLFGAAFFVVAGAFAWMIISDPEFAQGGRRSPWVVVGLLLTASFGLSKVGFGLFIRVR